MRQIDYIVLHCTAGPQSQTIESIKAYWRNVLGWKTPGYHYIIKPDGEAVNLLSIETPSNGVKGYNAHSIHISYIGGVQTDRNDPVNAYGAAIDNRTAEQKATQKALLEKFSSMFSNAIIQGHRDFSPDKNRNGIIEPSEWMKTCPSFSVKTWLNEIGFKSKAEDKFLFTTTRVNIRTGGGLKFPIAAPTLNKDEKVKKIGEAGDWFYVQVVSSKINGWIFSEYLKEITV